MKRVLLAITAVAAFVLAGCGGGGGGSSSGGSAAIFLTDDLSAGYDHVWVKIKQVSLGKVGGGSSVVFSNPSGTAVDLRSLRDASGRRFKFLVYDDNLSGEYNSVSVVLDENVMLFPTGATTGLPRTFQGSVAGEKTLTAAFAARSFGPGNDDLVIDFDLSQWNENGTQVTGAVIVAVAFDNGLGNDDRHERENYPGFISGLSGTAPNQTFTLTRGSHTVIVQCDANTRISRSDDDSAAPALANGIHVVVRGLFDVATNRLVAERVKITGDDDGLDDEEEAYGTTTNRDAIAGSLDLHILSVEDFIPSGDPIHVTSTAQTTYRNAAGVFVTRAEFFALLTDTTVIEVEGQYDSGSNTLVAKKMKFEDDEGDEDNAEVLGATSNVNLGAGTFTVTVSAVFGVNIPVGTPITIQTNAETQFRPLSGGDPDLTKEQFFAALSATPGHLVEVEGFWNGSVLTAFKCKLED